MCRCLRFRSYLASQVDAVALAKSLLPTVGVPAIEYNLPILEVYRYKLDALVLFFKKKTMYESGLQRRSTAMAINMTFFILHEEHQRISIQYD